MAGYIGWLTACPDGSGIDPARLIAGNQVGNHLAAVLSGIMIAMSLFDVPRNAHIQTLWGPRLRSLPAVRRREEKLPLNDGDHLWLSFAGPTSHNDKPLVLLLHGLAGCHDSIYIRSLQALLTARGVQSIAMNARGALRPNDRAQGYHAGETGDIHQVIDHLHQCEPDADIVAAGFSLGGSRLLNYLAGYGLDGAAPHPALKAAASVCVPLLLDQCAARMEQGFSRIYRNHLIGELVKKLEIKKEYLRRIDPLQAQRLDDLGDLRKLRSFRDFDGQVIAPLHGFTSADDYYSRCSAKGKLSSIQLPTLLIQAADDPFMTDAVMPTAAELGPQMKLENRNGGHVGFVDGPLWRPRYWLEQRLPEFLLSVTAHT